MSPEASPEHKQQTSNRDVVGWSRHRAPSKEGPYFPRGLASQLAIWRPFPKTTLLWFSLHPSALPATSIAEVFSRAIWSSRLSCRKPGSCLAKSTISCTETMASSVKWAKRCCRASQLWGSGATGQGCSEGQRREETNHLSQTSRSQLALWAQPPLPRSLGYRDSKPVRKGAPVTLLLGSHQLLNHAPLLWAELGQDLWR